ncbi:MAG: peptide chain release factor 2 [Candidatus Paceibacterota bacterium]
MTQDQVLQIVGEIKEKWSQIELGTDIIKLQKDLNLYIKESENPNLWDNPEQAQSVLKKLSQTQKKLQDLGNIPDTIEFIEQLILEQDSEFRNEIQILEKQINTYWQEMFFNEEYDAGNALLFIQAGAGGVDAQDFAEIVTKMYLSYAKSRNFEIDVIEYIQGQEAGIKRSLLHIKGQYAYGIFRQERGVHRLVRVSPFNAAGLRHTSFVMVQVLPEMDEISSSDIIINSNDIKIDVYRSQGAGGQSVNTTDSAVRVTHIPTGIVVAIQTERSQLQNKTLALNILKSKLWELKQSEHKQEKEVHTEDISISWGNHIRSYVMNPYKLVKDQRSSFETTDIDKILSGDLDEIITSVLVKKDKH